MKLAVFSDSHGEVVELREAAGWLIRKKGADILAHLGDNYEDAIILDKFNLRVIKVPGVFSQCYHDPEIPNRIIETLAGRKILFSHTEEKHKNDLPDDIDPQKVILSKDVDLALVGHTHKPAIEDLGGVVVFNPGHINKDNSRGHKPSFGLIDFDEGTLAVYDYLSRNVIKELKPAIE